MQDKVVQKLYKNGSHFSTSYYTHTKPNAGPSLITTALHRTCYMANILTTHFSYTLAKPILSKCPLIIFGSNAYIHYILKASLLQKQKWFGLYMAIINPSRITIGAFKESDIDDVLLWLGDERVIEDTRLETCNSKKEALDFIKNECIYPIRQSVCLDDHSIGMVMLLDSTIGVKGLPLMQ